MKKTIDLMTPNYEKGLKTILKQYETFCVKHELDEVDLQLERNGETINVTWIIYPESADSVHKVYQNYQTFTASCEEEVELAKVSFDDDEYYVRYAVKHTYVLSSL